MLQAVLSMFYSVQSILKSMQKQEDVYEEFVGQQDVTKEILEDVTKEVLEEKEERSHTCGVTSKFHFLVTGMTYYIFLEVV